MEAIQNWGAPLEKYQVNARAQKESLLAGSALLALGGIGVLVGLILAISQRSSSPLFIVLIGVLVAVPGVIALLNYRRRRDLCVTLFSEGFTYTCGGKTEVVPWADVAEVLALAINVKHQVTRYKYTVGLTDGRTYVFDSHVSRVGGLGKAIEQHTLQRMLPRAQEAFNQGETVRFAHLGVSKAGLSRGEAVLSWDQVADVKLHNGWLTVHQKGQRRPWINLSASKVPNLVLLMMMLKQLGF